MPRQKPDSTKAGKYVAEEMHRFKEGKSSRKHPIKNKKQAIAIGLSRARKKGLKVPKKPSRKAA